MKLLKYIFTVLLLCLPVYAIAQVPVSASHIEDAFERPLASGKLCFVPVNAASNPTGFRVGSIQVVPNSVCGVVSNGALQSGLSVAPSPTGVFYHIWTANRTTNAVIWDYGMTPIAGPTWTLDTYDPNLAVLPVSAISVGTVTQLPIGSSPTATITGAGPFLLNLGIPAGSCTGCTSGLGDPGASGLVKRTSLNNTTVATVNDLIAMWNSGSCSGYLKSDGTCGTPAGTGGGLSDPGVNGILKRTALNTTAPAGLSDILALWSSCTSGYLKYDGTCSTPSGSGSGGTINSGTAYSPAYYPMGGGTQVSGVAPFNGFGFWSTSAPPRAATSSDVQSLIGTSIYDAFGAAAARAAASNCTAGQYATGTGTNTTPCAQVQYSQIASTPSLAPSATTDTTNASNIASGTLNAARLPASFNAPTATQLASAPTKCSAGQSATGVDASGNAQGCFTPSAGSTYTAGQGVSITSNALSTTGVTTSQVPFANPNSLTAAMQIAVVPTTFAFTIPTNGTVSGSSTMRNATSQFYLGTLPTATWVATFYRYPAATAGCLTSTGVNIGTVSITSAGVQTWSITQTSFSIGDCLVVVAPSTVDTSASNPYGAIAVID